MKTGYKILITGLIGATIASLSYYFLIYKPEHPKQDPASPPNNNTGGGNSGGGNNSGSGNNTNNNTGNNTSNTGSGTGSPTNTGTGLNTGGSTAAATIYIGQSVKAKNSGVGFYEKGFFVEVGDLTRTFAKNQLIGTVMGADSSKNFYKVATASGEIGFVQKDSIIKA